MNVAGSTYNCHFLYNGLVILTLEEPVIQPVYFFFIYSSCSLDLFHFFFLYLPSIQQLLGQNCLFSEQNKKSLVETKAMVIWYYCAAGRRERGKNIAFGFKGAVCWLLCALECGYTTFGPKQCCSCMAMLPVFAIVICNLDRMLLPTAAKTLEIIVIARCVVQFSISTLYNVSI